MLSIVLSHNLIPDLKNNIVYIKYLVSFHQKELDNMQTECALTHDMPVSKTIEFVPSKNIRKLVEQLAKYCINNKLYRSAGGRDWTEIEGPLLTAVNLADRTRSATKHPILNGHLYLDPIPSNDQRTINVETSKSEFAIIGVVRLYRDNSANLWNFTVDHDNTFTLGNAQS